MKTPPYRIETPRLVLRPYQPSDAPLLKKSIDESIEHLKEFMPWARHEPSPVETKIELLRRFRSNFDRDEDYPMGMFTPDESVVLGSCGFHTRAGFGGFEIGYWVNVNYARQGIVTEAVKGLIRAGFEVSELERIEIRCEEANLPSAGIPENLGFQYEGTLRKRPIGSGQDLGDLRLYVMFREDYEKSALRDFPVKAFDAIGRRLI